MIFEIFTEQKNLNIFRWIEEVEGAIERQTGGGEEVIFKDRVEEVTEEEVVGIAVAMKIVLRTMMDRAEEDTEEVAVVIAIAIAT